MMSAPTIFTIHSSRHGEIVETHRIGPFVAVAKARRLHGMARLHHGQNRTAFQAARFGQASRTLAALIDGVAGSAAVRLQLQSELPVAAVT
jgi:CO/xanthine dehydrogenase FAD-binding subunit